MTVSNNISSTGMDGYFNLLTDQGSDFFNIGYARSASIQVVVDNTDADGYLKPQVSNNKTNWVDVAFVDEDGVVQADGYHLLSGQDANHMFDISDVAAGWLRLFYDRTSGTGGANFYVHVKKM